MSACTRVSRAWNSSAGSSPSGSSIRRWLSTKRDCAASVAIANAATAGSWDAISSCTSGLNTGTIAPDVVYCTNSVCALGIAEPFLQVSISPNPASESFSVAAAVPVESVQLYALTGELVWSVPFSAMAIDGIVPGMYFAGINGTASGLQRLIVD